MSGANPHPTSPLLVSLRSRYVFRKTLFHARSPEGFPLWALSLEQMAAVGSTLDIISKNPASFNTAAGDIIERTRKMNSQRSCHASSINAPSQMPMLNVEI